MLSIELKFIWIIEWIICVDMSQFGLPKKAEAEHVIAT